MNPHFPTRIVCLTEETTETLYLLGQQDRIVGISGFTVRPPQARKEKPKVSAFTSAKIDKILALKPDLVIGFSDLQADIAAELIRAGVNVWLLNHRSVEEILSMILMLGAIVGETPAATALVDGYVAKINAMKADLRGQDSRPLVYFEEWDDPMISGIRWVSELIDIAGGKDCFSELGKESLGKNRIIADASEVIKRKPDIIVGSWCGKKFRPDKVRARPGWSAIPAVVHDQVFEIKSPKILQPGPAALGEGLDELRGIIERWHNSV